MNRLLPLLALLSACSAAPAPPASLTLTAAPAAIAPYGSTRLHLTADGQDVTREALYSLSDASAYTLADGVLTDVAPAPGVVVTAEYMGLRTQLAVPVTP